MTNVWTGITMQKQQSLQEQSRSLAMNSLKPSYRAVIITGTMKSEMHQNYSAHVPKNGHHCPFHACSLDFFYKGIWTLPNDGFCLPTDPSSWWISTGGMTFIWEK
jgi:hypothetical protein